jgi:UPF0042 nucleotide-binding protein
MSDPHISSLLDVVMITGLSGSGISTALEALEDEGYFCVDNLPFLLIPKLIEMAKGQGHLNRLALGIDTRTLKEAQQTSDLLRIVNQLQINHRILYLEASTSVLLRRFSTSRRTHPLGQPVIPPSSSIPSLSLSDALQKEIQVMQELRQVAHEIYDTSDWNVHECKRRVKIFASGKQERQLMIQMMSFGFRHGVPLEADIIWDVRFLPNPHFDPVLRPFSGLDKPVQEFVYGHQSTDAFLKGMKHLLQQTLPAYQREGKAYLTVGIGCTGGHHRSVAIVENLASYIQSQGWPPHIKHRDIKKVY